MRILLLLLIITSGFSSFGQGFAPEMDTSSPNTAPKIKLEIIDMCGCGQETHYAGGIAALHKFINENISFPDDMDWGNIEYVRTYVQFIVERDGHLTNVEVVRTNFPEADEYILAAFGKMKNWVAGEIDCMAARTRLRIPISLVLK